MVPSRTQTAVDLRDGRSVAAHLAARGLLAPGAHVAVAPLAGGVSSEVVAASGPELRVVLKRALPRLRVTEEWLADERRLRIETRALRIAGELAPAAVPAVLDFDEETGILVLEHAPSDLLNWRDELLAGRIDAAPASELGRLLALWHHETSGTAALADLADRKAFVQLRIDPFYKTVAARHQLVAAGVERLIEELLTASVCLVHGDFSPKNVLANGRSLRVLDWEVAHLGEPVFDLAFLLTHLVLKAVHRPAAAGHYRAAAAAFLEGYGDGPGRGSAALTAHIGCLLLARVDGKSPAGYLDETGRARTRVLGLELVRFPPRAPLEIWERL